MAPLKRENNYVICVLIGVFDSLQEKLCGVASAVHTELNAHKITLTGAIQCVGSEKGGFS